MTGGDAVAALAGRRVVLVTPRYPPFVGGTEVHTAEVAARLREVGVDVVVLSSDTEARRPVSADRDGVPVRIIPARPARSDIYYAPSLARELAGLRPELVHVQGYHTLFGPMAMRAARRIGAPHVVTFHSGGHASRVRNVLRPAHQLALRTAFLQADALIAVSEFERSLFARRLRISPERIELIPSGTNLRIVGGAAAPGEGRTVITSLGRLERYKGHQQMIRALPHLLRTRPDVELRLIGTGSYERRLRALVDRLGVGERVRFLSVPTSARDELTALLRESSLVTLLSEYESQGLGAFEALSMQLPLLVLESTALAELAAEGLAAAVPPGCSPAGLADVVDELLQAEAEPRTVPSPPGWDRTVNALAARYQQILAGRTGTGTSPRVAGAGAPPAPQDRNGGSRA